MKKVKLGMFILLALILVLTPLIAVACEEEAPPPPPPDDGEEPLPPPKELEIGAILGLTGPGSEALAPFGDGVKACADWINDEGGLTINGDTYLIKILMEDHRMTPDGAIAAANKLVYEDKVKFILGPVIPWFSMAIMQITEEAKVLRCKFSGVGMPEEMNPDTPYLFTAVVETATLPYVYDYLVEAYPEVKTVALICPDEPGALFAREISKKEAEARGLTVVFEEAYPFGTEDFYPLWTKIMAAKADAVEFGQGFASWYGAILKQGRELGFEGPLCSFSGSGEPYLIRDIAGMDLATDFFLFDYDLKSPEMPPMIKEIETILSDKYGLEMRCDIVYGWMLLWFMAQAIEEAQSLDTTEVAQSWEKMKSIESPFGTSYVGGLESYGINHVMVFPQALLRIMNGEVEHIKWVLPELP